MKQGKVSLALCTFNGERYLDEQLASLVRQTRFPDELIVCDDCSTDGTIEILRRFSETAPFPIHITVNDKCLGPAANFGKAAGLCSGDIVFFCDQDDLWHENKIEVEIAAMVEAERGAGADTPILVHADLEVVDKSLAPLYPSFMGLMHPKLELFNMSYILGDNVAVGCATAVNRALLEVALPLPKQAVMHDWWFAQCAAGCGKIVYIDQPLMQYRQHQSNQIGASSWLKRLSSALLAPRRQWKRRLASFRTAVVQAKALEERLAARSCDMKINRQTISDYAALLDAGVAARIRRTFRHGYGRSGRLGMLWFLIKAIFA